MNIASNAPESSKFCPGSEYLVINGRCPTVVHVNSFGTGATVTVDKVPLGAFATFEDAICAAGQHIADRRNPSI